jgi:geranylgeranylglycerol-phosphate geranylgeranyltransferase
MRETTWPGEPARRTPVEIWRPAFWQAFSTTMRPYLIFVSGASGLVGMAYIPQPDFSRLVLGFIPLFLSYGLGQALTDCFQMDTDAFSSPYRPLVKGMISRKQVLAVSLTGLGIGLAILTALNAAILFLGLLAVGGLLTYTRLKRTYWGGPPWNAWIVALLPFMGRFIEPDMTFGRLASHQNVSFYSFVFAALAVFFGYANFVLMGYFKDISADRTTGYRTLPVVFGWRAAALASDGLALAAAVTASLSLSLLDNPSLLGGPILVAAILVNLNAQVQIHRIHDESLAYRPIASVVRSFILYCAAIILSLKPEWLLFMAIFYLWFEVALSLRPEKSQV